LKVLFQIPAEERETAALKNSDYLRRRLQEENIGFYEFPDDNRSPIVSCTPADVENLREELVKQKIFCSVRSGRLRVSPHFYNTKEEIDTLVSNLR
jgi:selenocysteine lyase/cysteine desulfurase